MTTSASGAAVLFVLTLIAIAGGLVIAIYLLTLVVAAMVSGCLLVFHAINEMVRQVDEKAEKDKPAVNAKNKKIE